MAQKEVVCLLEPSDEANIPFGRRFSAKRVETNYSHRITNKLAMGENKQHIGEGEVKSLHLFDPIPSLGFRVQKLEFKRVASVAQEEARSVSENQKWRIRKDFEKGLIWGGKNAYGYRIVNKKMVLVPEEAKLVKRIFQLYIGGLGFHKISKLLNDEGIPAMRAKKWNKQSLQQIIANINYTGDLLLQKTYNENYLTKKKKINKGELDQFFVENDHEAIITKDEYYAALEIRRKRVEYFKLDNFKVHTYPLTGFVRCGNCGKNYNHKRTRYTEKWSCVTYQNVGKAECDAKSVPDAELTRITLEVLNIKELDRDLIEDNLEFIEVFKDNKLLYHLLNGKTVERTWNDISRRDSWTEEMKKEARRKSLAYIGKEE